MKQEWLRPVLMIGFETGLVNYCCNNFKTSVQQRLNGNEDISKYDTPLSTLITQLQFNVTCLNIYIKLGKQVNKRLTRSNTDL